ncbi:MAG: hypothetical protein DMD91_01095 [Candidatus Rokuibacteriota bacterium]|nr:MAG: hypothetical protein DMD91_01095 [Candidatus Rokubacteria bacterium]
MLATSLRTTPRRLTELAASRDPISSLFKTTLAAAADEALLAKRRQGLGQLLLAGLAERAFERLYRKTLGAEELHLEDERSGYTDTDYRVLNGSRRPVFRLNIKFHGTLFVNAKAMVGLEPTDCFALATYKVWQGMQKQQGEVLPYVFAIVSVPGLTAESVGAIVPARLVHLAAFAYAAKSGGKRDVEDAIVRHLIEDEQPKEVAQQIAAFSVRIEGTEWRVISARKADKLLRELLFERVYAIRQRSFAQTQVNMHFSLSQDLTALVEFLRLWRERGPQGLASMLERGLV